MNRKGFTLVELLATIVILGIIAGITIVSTSGSLSGAKKKTESAFVKTLVDGINMYLDSDAKSLSYNNMGNNCVLHKTHGDARLFKVTSKISFNDIITSRYKPLTESDFVNPNNKDTKCKTDVGIINIYRDSDFIYYYDIDNNDVRNFGCLTDVTTEISNLPQLPEGCSK